MGALRVGLISDTHGLFRPGVRERFAGVSLIVHAGDWSDTAAVALVRGIGVPVVGVHGNVEEPRVRAALPATAEVDVGGLRIGVVHDAGAQAGRLERMRRRFPGCGGVVFGHSHIPLHEVAGDGFFILNPGSPTDRRRSPRHSMAEIVIAPGAAPAVSFLAVDDPPGPLPPELVRGAAP